MAMAFSCFGSDSAFPMTMALNKYPCQVVQCPSVDLLNVTRLPVPPNVELGDQVPVYALFDADYLRLVPETNGKREDVSPVVHAFAS